MQLAQAVLTPALTALVVIAAGYVFKERIDRLEAKVDQLPTREEMDAGFAGLDKRTSRVESEVAALRSDLTHIALAVGGQPKPRTG
jgi:hypothetical protein